VVEQAVCQRVSIDSGYAIEEQQLQNIQLIKVIQTFLAESVLQAFSMTFMNRHIFTPFVDFSCYF
jgi:hypothetical protein